MLSIPDVTATLKDWGLTFGTATAVAVVLIVLFVVSTREFVLWLLKIRELVSLQKKTLKRIEALEKKLNPSETTTATTVTSAAAAVAATAAPSPTEDPPKKRFELRS